MGQPQNQEDRMTKALITKDSVPPIIYFLSKDHKQIKPGHQYPPTRPVYEAVNGPISRLQEVLSDLLDRILDSMKS